MLQGELANSKDEAQAADYSATVEVLAHPTAVFNAFGASQTSTGAFGDAAG